jgi:hypothetical protein
MCGALNEYASRQYQYTQPRRMSMDRYALITGLALMFCGSVLIFIQQTRCTMPAAQTSVGITIVNNTNDTVLIMFKRSIHSPEHAKLLESGEFMDFGTVYEASVQSYSTLWGYVAPAKHVLFSAKLSRLNTAITHLVMSIKGIVGRSLFHPFGEWDYDIYPGQQCTGLHAGSRDVQTVLDAFPTAKRKIMYTPRYILGLPQFSELDDAIEACSMLESKWSSRDFQCDAKLVSDVIYILGEARKAFDNDQADIPLHIPVHMRVKDGAEYEEMASLAWEW